MLVELFLIPIVGLITILMTYLPSMTLPTNMVDNIHTGFLLVSTMGALIPLDTVRSVIHIIMTFYAIKFAFSFANFIFRKVPTIS